MSTGFKEGLQAQKVEGQAVYVKAFDMTHLMDLHGLPQDRFAELANDLIPIYHVVSLGVQQYVGLTALSDKQKAARELLRMTTPTPNAYETLVDALHRENVAKGQETLNYEALQEAYSWKYRMLNENGQIIFGRDWLDYQAEKRASKSWTTPAVDPFQLLHPAR